MTPVTTRVFCHRLFLRTGLALLILTGLFSRQVSAAVLPLSLSIQGMAIGGLSGQSSLSNSTGSYDGSGYGGGLLATLHLTSSIAARGQANVLHLTGNPVLTAFPVTLGLEYDFLQFSSLFYLYAAVDGGYNNTQAQGTAGNNLTWDGALGVNLGPVYAEIRYAQIAGPVISTNQGQLGTLTYIPIVVGFTFF